MKEIETADETAKTISDLNSRQVYLVAKQLMTAGKCLKHDLYETLRNTMKREQINEAVKDLYKLGNIDVDAGYIYIN